jgi:hypothetical protein
VAFATSVTTGTTTPAGLTTPTTVGAAIDAFGVYEYRPNLTNLASGDTMTVRVTSEAGVVTQLGTYTGDQAPDGVRLQFVVAQHETGVLLRIEFTAGTARAVPFELVRMYDDSVT